MAEQRSSRKFKSFISVRVAKTQETIDPQELSYIRCERNSVDALTKPRRNFDRNHDSSGSRENEDKSKRITSLNRRHSQQLQGSVLNTC